MDPMGYSGTVSTGRFLDRFKRKEINDDTCFGAAGARVLDETEKIEKIQLLKNEKKANWKMTTDTESGNGIRSPIETHHHHLFRWSLDASPPPKESQTNQNKRETRSDSGTTTTTSTTE